MRTFDRQELGKLLATHEEPCLSLTMPAHRSFPESEQDPVRYRNLTRDLGTALEKKYGKRETGPRELLAQVERLGAEGPEGDSAAWWNHQKEGLAVYAAPGFFAWYRVPIVLREIAVVSNSFHVKPLLPLLHSNARYHVLALTRGKVTLWDGNGETIVALGTKDVPANIEEALGRETDTSRQGLTFHGTSSSAPIHGSAGAMHGSGGAVHGSGRPSDEEKKELRRFFREVDKRVEERHSKPTGRPLILAAVDYYHPLFREVSKNPQLLQQGILQDPKSLSPSELLAAAQEIIAPMRETAIARAVEEYGKASAWSQGSDELHAVGSAAVGGRVKLLMLEKARRIWGRVDRATGEVATGGAEGNPDDADVLDDLAELVLLNGGDVLVVPSERMPSGRGLAAIFRF